METIRWHFMFVNKSVKERIKRDEYRSGMDASCHLMSVFALSFRSTLSAASFGFIFPIGHLNFHHNSVSLMGFSNLREFSLKENEF